MRKHLGKASLLLVIIFVFAGVFAGCGNANENVSDSPSQPAQQTEEQQPAADQAPADPIRAEIDKGEVKLVMYLVGDAAPDQQLVYDEVNKLMKKDINTTVEVKNIPWADSSNKYQLIFASGEEFDCAYSAGWMSYVSLASKNAFYALTEDQIKTYAPNTYQLTPSSFWDAVKVNNNICMLPANKGQVVPQCAIIRGDLREKNNIPEVKTYDDFINYMIAQAKDKSIVTFNGDGGESQIYLSFMTQRYGLEDAVPQAGIRLSYITNPQGGGDWKYTWDLPEYREFLGNMKKMNEAGVFPKSMLSNKISAMDNFKAGKSACFLGKAENISAVYNDLSKSHPEWKIEVANLSDGIKQVGERATDSGFSVHAGSKHVERAMMMYDLFRSKKEYFDLTNYGIAGKHYEPVGDLEYKALDEGKNFPAFGNCPWGWAEAKYYRQDAALPQIVKDYVNVWNSNVEIRPIHLWLFDDSKVKNEIAALKEITSTVVSPLEHGFLDVDKYLEILKQKSMDAGIEKVMNEAKTQTDAFMEAYSK